MAKEMVMTFVDGRDTGVSARAVLLEEQAPKTCAAVWAQLPIAVTAGHGAYSGTIVGVSRGVEMINTSRTPASISVLSG